MTDEESFLRSIDTLFKGQVLVAATAAKATLTEHGWRVEISTDSLAFKSVKLCDGFLIAAWAPGAAEPSRLSLDAAVIGDIEIVSSQPHLPGNPKQQETKALATFLRPADVDALFTAFVREALEYGRPR